MSGMCFGLFNYLIENTLPFVFTIGDRIIDIT